MFFFFMSIRLFFFYFLCFRIYNNVCPKYCQRTLSIIYKKKNRKSLKQSEIINYQPKPFENKNIVGIKSVITEYLKTLN